QKRLVLLVWTAPGGIECARMRSCVDLKQRRPSWTRLAELEWIRRSTFFRSYVASATALDVRSRPSHVPYMFTVRGGSHGSALPLVRRGSLAQSGQGGADVRPRRRKRVPAPALARDRRQAGLPELRLPGLL